MLRLQVAGVITQIGLYLGLRVTERLVDLFQLSIASSMFWNELVHLLRPLLWSYTIGSLIGASLLAATLVSLGVGLGALSPNFAAENPLQVGLSLGGFGYMAAALALQLAPYKIRVTPSRRG